MYRTALAALFAVITASPALAADINLETDVETIDEQEVTVENMHGFRLGYTYINLSDSYNGPLRSNNMMTMGYELTQVIEGGSWLDLIVVENLTISGLDQSLFIPSFNLLVGFEIADQIQVGIGPNIVPFAPQEDIVHMAAAIGWTPKVGAFNMPVHAIFIPDPEGNFRVGATIGVNWK